MSQSADSFEDYLELYNNSWSDLAQYDRGPEDYEERTLYSTWNISYQQVREQDLAAAELLKMLAFLDNQDLWHKLFHRGYTDAPAWWIEVNKSRVRFNQAISILHNYSLLEVSSGRYSLHKCQHDWMLEHLGHELDHERYRIAVQCVASNVSWRSESEYWAKNRRLLPHARRLQHARIKEAITCIYLEPEDLSDMAYLYMQYDMYAEAQEMYERALRGYEMTQGLEAKSTLDTVNNLGIIYAEQGRLAKAEEMYIRVLQSTQKVYGLSSQSTWKAIASNGKRGLKDWEYSRMPAGESRILGGPARGNKKKGGKAETRNLASISMLDTLNNLGNVYARQGKTQEAEEMYVQALRGYEERYGPEHTSTLDAITNLALLYGGLGKMKKAEDNSIRALRGKEKAWGPDHTSTLDSVVILGDLYRQQGKMSEAQEMYKRALQELEKTHGADHPATQRALNSLAMLQASK